MRVNLGLLISSLFLSILLWLHVRNEEALKVTRTITFPIRYLNLPDGYILKTAQAEVQVMAIGSVDAHEQLTQLRKGRDADKLFGAVDLTDAKPEVATYRVRLPRNILNKVDLEIADPPEVSVVVQEELSKPFSVEAIPTNEPHGFVFSQADLRPSKVVLKGSANDLARVGRVRALFDLSDYRPGEKVVTRVEVLDEAGKPMPGIEVTPSSVDVYPALAAAPPERSMVVSVRLAEGTLPAPGYRLVNFSVNPLTVMVRGDKKVLDRIQSIPTAPIRLSGIKTSATREVRLISPSGVQIMDADRVRVRLQIEPIPVLENPAPPPRDPAPPAGNGGATKTGGE